MSLITERTALLLFPVINHQSGKQILQIHPHIHFLYTRIFLFPSPLFIAHSYCFAYLLPCTPAHTRPLSVEISRPRQLRDNSFLGTYCLCVPFSFYFLLSHHRFAIRNPSMGTQNFRSLGGCNAASSSSISNHSTLSTSSFCRVSFSASTGLVYM